jgi:hypothetical protein
VQSVNALPLLSNNTDSKTLLHKSGAVRSVRWLFSIGVPAWPWQGETRHWKKTF